MIHSSCTARARARAGKVSVVSRASTGWSGCWDMAAALHQALRVCQRFWLSWQVPGVLLPVFPRARDSVDGAQNLDVELN